MTDRDRCVFVQQHERHGLADDIASPHDHGAFSGDWNLIALEHLNDPSRRTRARRGAIRYQAAHVERMKSVGILRGIDGQQDLLFVYMLRQWALYKDCIDLRVVVEEADELQDFAHTHLCGRSCIYTPYP